MFYNSNSLNVNFKSNENEVLNTFGLQRYNSLRCNFCLIKKIFFIF